VEESSPTGRLFRSLHADGDLAEDAVIALDLDEVVRLSTVSLSPPEDSRASSSREASSDPPAADARLSAGLPDEQPPTTIDADFAHLFVDSKDGDTPADDVAQSVPPTPTSPGQHRRRRNSAAMSHGIPAWIAMLMIVGVTLLMAIADVVVTGAIGWLTGIALVVVSGYAAASVRPQDGYWAIVSPPLAFLITTLIVGQFTISGGGFWVRQGLIIPFTLGRAALWIVLATAAAALIVSIRRRRALLG
jgi:hypothetical protein